MAIQFFAEQKTFLLQGKSSTYACMIDAAGHLCHLHWGAPLQSPEELPSLYSLCQRMSLQALKVGMDDCQEYRGFGGNSFIEPALKVTFADGTRDLYLVYAHHEIKDDKLQITLQDEIYPIEVTLHYRVCEEFDIIERFATIRNVGTADFTLESVYSANWHMPYRDHYRATTFAGGYSHEYNIIREPLHPGRKVLETRRGLSGPEFIPFFLLDEGKATEDYGQVYYGSIVWSGNWKLILEQDHTERTVITGGINDFDFAYTLAPGQTYDTPMFFGGYTEGGFGAASRRLHRYERQEIIHPTERNRELPILYNTHGTFVNRVYEQGVLEEIDAAHQVGIELFVLDGGWSGYGDIDSPVNNGQAHRVGVGIWNVNPDRFPHGLKVLADRAHSHGMKFGLWIEPEAVYHESPLVKEHPEWLVGFDGRKPVVAGVQCYSLNFANDECCDYVTQRIIDLIRENDIDYLKNDFNRSNPQLGFRGMPIKDQWSSSDQYVRNMWRCYQKVKECFPHLIFENSAGGGKRTDLGMLRFSGRMHRSDNQDPLDSVTMYEGMSYFMPTKFQGGACFVSDDYSRWLNRRETTVEYQAHVGMLSSLSISTWLKTMKEPEKEEMKRLIALDKQIRPTVQLGDLYRLASVYEKPYGAYAYLSEDKRHAVVFLMGQNLMFGRMPENLRLKDLDENGKYKVTGHGTYHKMETIRLGYKDEIPTHEQEYGVLTGRCLMNNGLHLFLQGHATSEILTIDLVE